MGVRPVAACIYQHVSQDREFGGVHTAASLSYPHGSYDENDTTVAVCSNEENTSEAVCSDDKGTTAAVCSDETDSKPLYAVTRKLLGSRWTRMSMRRISCVEIHTASHEPHTATLVRVLSADRTLTSSSLLSLRRASSPPSVI
jgi:hypothetical protein